MQNWWGRMKVMYCDAYFLMFEEGVLYYEDDQEVALWRAQVLMFFFVLQCLFEAAWESHNGLERVFQVLCPPFALLPLRPPRGMEASAAVIRGIVARARLCGEMRPESCLKNLVEEAGAFQDTVREAFELQLCEYAGIAQSFDTDGSDEITLREFIVGFNSLPERHRLEVNGVPKKVLDGIVSDLATEMFFEMDAEGNGTLTASEIQEAIKARDQRKRKTEAGKETTMVRKMADHVLEAVPGTSANTKRQEFIATREGNIQKAMNSKLQRQSAIARKTSQFMFETIDDDVGW